jgi:nuclear transport factor 2 (NTF2) superfamily protein
MNRPVNENIQTVIQFNEALNAKDVSRMMQCMTQDCIFENTYPPPNGERFVGQDAVRTFWENFFQNVYEAHIEVEEIFGFENRCVMRWVYSWKNRLGETGHIRGIDAYTLVNHLISEKLSYVKG